MLISIITVVKNDINGFRDTLWSLKKQNFTDFEWIIIDGKSNDGTEKEIVNVGIPGTKVVSENDDGIYDAMNKGLELASGDFVLFLNAGDTFRNKETLNLVSGYLIEKNVDFLYGDSEEFYIDSFMYKKANTHLKINLGMFACHQSMYYRGEIAKIIKYNKSYKISGDYDFTARFLKQANNIKYIKKSLCIFDRGGVSNSNKRAGRLENFVIQRDVLKVSLSVRIGNQIRYSLASFIIQFLPFIYKKIRYVKQD